MQTTQEILDAIRKLPADKQDEIRRLLAIEALSQSDKEKRLQKLRDLCGSVNVGGFLMEDFDREWMYGDD